MLLDFQNFIYNDRRQHSHKRLLASIDSKVNKVHSEVCAENSVDQVSN